MKKKILIPLVLSNLVSSSLFLATTCPAQAIENKASTPEEALSRDLGISQQDAQNKNKQQERAVYHDQEAKRMLGSHYAGSLLEPDGTLVVKVKGNITLSNKAYLRYESVALSQDDLKSL